MYKIKNRLDQFQSLQTGNGRILFCKKYGLRKSKAAVVIEIICHVQIVDAKHGVFEIPIKNESIIIPVGFIRFAGPELTVKII